LCGIRDLEIWKDALHELKSGRNIIRGSNNELFWKTLRISYDHLNKKHQDTFLDIVCFFIGLKKKCFVECIGMEMIDQALWLYYKT
jgi:hypothetical protein